MMKVKVQYGSDIRRWHYPETKRFQNLTSFIIKTFNFLHGREFYVQFEDDEGDRLTLTSETDFEDAFSTCEQEGKKSLKIFVVKGNIDDAHSNDSNAPSIPASPQVVISSNQNQMHDEDEDENKSLHEEKKIDEQSSCNEKCNEQSSCNQNENCFHWRQLVLDFVQNKEIELLLPQLVRRLVVELRKQNSGNQNDKNAKKTLLMIVTEVLNEEKFQPIVKHELFQKKIKLILPCIANKMEMYQHVLLTFNEDAIESWVPHLINLLKYSVGNYEHIDISLESDGICPFMNIRDFGLCSEQDNKEAVHHGITCDSCQVSPIQGVRYKCCVCNNYDLCSDCESLGKHDSSHPLLKILRPVDRCANSPYYGLHETMKIFGHRKRGHGQGHRHWRQHGSMPRRCRGGFQWNQQAPFFPGNPFGWQQFAKNCHVSSDVSAKFICDVNIPDGTYCPNDTILTKTWRVRNDGDSEWGDDVELVFFKGNECLLLEKRFVVANAKPGGEIDVSIMLKTPVKAGRYITYFRFQKNGKFFGDQLWIDILVADDKTNQKDQKEEQSNLENGNIPLVVHCKCGEVLVKMAGSEAYQGSNVNCDQCGVICSKSIVYHCPAGSNLIHRGGYDLCTNCAQHTVSIQPFPFPLNDFQNNDENDKDNYELISEVNVNPIIKNEDSNLKPEVIEMESQNNENELQNANENHKNENEKQEIFPFQESLNRLKEMGFDENETVKALLIKHKGQVDRVVQELIGA